MEILLVAVMVFEDDLEGLEDLVRVLEGLALFDAVEDVDAAAVFDIEGAEVGELDGAEL
jgi:hypothetical protein